MRKNLIQQRKSHKMTQEEISIFLNITTRHYRQLEAGTSEGSVSIWKKLAQLFHSSIDFLLEQEVDKTDYIKSSPSGLDEAKELNTAAKDFDVSVEMIVDIAEDGRIDTPQYREQAKRLNAALTAALN